jgi:heat shock protein HtpX
MDESQLLKHKLRNSIQSILLIVALMVILGLLGWLIGGRNIAFFAIVLVVALYFFNPVLSPQLILRMYRTRQIMPYEAPNLYAMLRVIAQRAELPTVPKLFYLPSDVMNAFAVGMPDNSVIALSDGLLRRLSQREIAGVLAHEVSHIAHEDIRIMGFADLVGRITDYLSLIGQVLLLINLFLLLFGTSIISWTAILILIFAPIITDLLQLALSRNREYDADLSAAELLGDPQPLISALLKMERYQGHLMEQIFLPGHRSPEPSLLRTHPPTKERVERLLELKERRLYYPQTWKPIILHQEDIPLSLLIAQTSLRPRWYISGIRF